MAKGNNAAIVEPLIGRHLEVPPALAALLDKPLKCTEIEPSFSALQKTWGVRG
jgi:hypothetical protein